jgi:outer membrane protein assembly factor BamB
MPRFFFLGLVAALAGCGATDNAPAPTPLEDFKPRLSLRADWAVSLGWTDPQVSRPAASGDAVYAAGSFGDLVRLDAKSGAQRWHAVTRGSISSGVATDGERVLVGTTKGVLLAYSTLGKLLWRAEVSSEVLSAPSIEGGLALVRSADSRVHALDLNDGSKKWEYQASTPPLILRASPAVSRLSGLAIAGFPGGKLLALDLVSGNLKWEAVVSAPKGDNELERLTDVAGTPLLAGDAVCAAAFQGQVGCFDGKRGTPLWTRPISTAQALAGDGKYIYVVDDASNVLALDRLTGASVWKQDKLFSRKLTAPAVFLDYVVVGDTDGRLFALNRAGKIYAYSPR